MSYGCCITEWYTYYSVIVLFYRLVWLDLLVISDLVSIWVLVGKKKKKTKSKDSCDLLCIKIHGYNIFMIVYLCIIKSIAINV